MCKENESDLPFNEFSTQLSFEIFRTLVNINPENASWAICGPGENLVDIGLFEIARRARKIAAILSGVDPKPDVTSEYMNKCSCTNCTSDE